MQPRITLLNDKKLVGIKAAMSISADATPQLWKAFRSRSTKVPYRSSAEFISLQEYPTDYFKNFNPNTEFVKWACIEVVDFEAIPHGMQNFILTGGTYAVFDYKGGSADRRIFQYIYGDWLPGSGYALDCRPHFEVLGATYKTNDPNAEEEIWIPICKL